MVVTTTTDKQKDSVLHQQKKSKVYIKDAFNALIFDLHFDLCYKFKCIQNETNVAENTNHCQKASNNIHIS